MRKWLITIILLFLTIVFCSYILFNLKEERQINNELNTMYKTINNWNNLKLEEFQKIAQRTVTKGKYRIIERASKNYINDNINCLNRIITIINNNELSNMITINNYKEANKDFTSKISAIESNKQKLNEELNKYYSFFNEEVIISYLPSGSYSSKYTKLYQEKIIDKYIENYNKEEIKSSVNKFIETLEEEKKVLVFLEENKDSWELKENNIVFKTEKLLNDYNNLLQNINY